MKSILALVSLAVFSLAVVAGDPPRLKCPPKINQNRPQSFDVASQATIYPPQGVYSSGIVPAGYHAHQTLDGRTIIHGNENVGNAAAHAGVAYPWVRTAEAGQIYTGQTYSSPTYSLPTGSSNCPGGNCPAPTQTRGLIFRR